MAIRALVHIHNDETLLCELDELPKPTDNYIVVRNPRRRDGKPLTFIEDSATGFLYPWNRITFIELFEDIGQRENVIGIFREADGVRRRS